MLRLDNCKYDAAVTNLVGYTREQAIDALENGYLGCWLCQEDGEDGKEVWLYDDDEVVWKGWEERLTPEGEKAV